MAVEQLANNAQTTLNGAINNSTTSVVVTSASGFPSSGDFKILIDSEIMNVTGVSGTTFTVQRGQEGTSAASHSDTAVVTCILTKQALTNFRSDFQLFGTLASRPAAGISGRTYKPTDFPIEFYDDGANWVAHYAGSIPFTTPSDGSFSWVNQGSATVDTSKYGTYLECATNGNTASYRLRVKSHTAPLKYTVAFTPHFVSSNAGGCGLVFRNSTSGKFVTFLLWAGGAQFDNLKVFSENWNDPTTYGGSATFSNDATAILSNHLFWFQLEDNNTNVIFRHSRDGYKFTTRASVSRTAFEASGWNQVGYFVQPHDQEVGMRILSWKEE